MSEVRFPKANINQTHNLLHGDEKDAWAHAGYNGVEKRAEVLAKAPETNWQVAAKRGSIKSMAEGPLKELYRQEETLKASVRAKMEHSFHIIKNLFGYKKTRFPGLSKNSAQIYYLFALVNLLMGRKTRLLAD